MKCYSGLSMDKQVKRSLLCHCCVIGCHGNSLLHFLLTKKLWGTFRGGDEVLKLVYLNDNSKLDALIWYTVFLHGYLSACKISTVRTFTSISWNSYYSCRFQICLHNHQSATCLFKQIQTTGTTFQMINLFRYSRNKGEMLTMKYLYDPALHVKFFKFCFIYLNIN